MASDVGVKLSVSGVSQFKSNMNAAKSSVKALDAELKLNAAQYRASGDAEEYLANRARILSEQIKAQEGVVANAEKALETMASQGVDKASTAYTQMVATLNKAKTELVNMQSAAGDAGDELKKVGDSGNEAASSLKSIDSGIKFQNISSALDKVDGILKKILQSAINIGKTIWSWGSDAAAWGDDLNTRATMYGMDVETLQRYDVAAKRIDTDIETIIKVGDKLRAATQGSKEGVALITQGETQFGIALKDATGQTRDQMDVLWELIDILGQVENETDRNALAQEYFGKSYRDMIPLIEAGKDAWDEAAEGATVVSEENVNKLTSWSDKLDEVNQRWETFSMTMAATLAPAFEKVGDALIRMMDVMQQWAESDEGQQTISRIGDAVASWITRFAETDFEALFDKATAAVGEIAEFLSSLSSEDVLNSIKAIGAAIGAWTIGDTALRAVLLGKTIFGGGGGAGAAVATGTVASKAAGALKILSGLAVGTYIAHSLTNNFETTDDLAYQALESGATVNGHQIYYSPSGVFGYKSDRGKTSAGDYSLTLGTGGKSSFGIEKYGIEGISEQEYLDYFYNDVAPETTKKAFVALDETAGAIITLTKEGEMFIQGIEDINAFFTELETALTEGESTDLPEAGQNAAQQIAEGAEEGSAAVTESGVEISEAFYEGLTENIAAAYNAGAAIGAAFISGAASAGGGGGGNSEYNFENIGAVNVYGVTNPAEIAAAYRGETQKKIAGYGG